MVKILKFPICGCFHKEKTFIFHLQNFSLHFFPYSFLVAAELRICHHEESRKKNKPECAKNFRNIEKKIQ